MSTTRPLRRTAALAAVAVVALSACGNNAEDSDGGSDGGSSGGGGSSASGEQPDVNGDGDVTIGVLSPDDLNDNGYYEAFVVKAQELVDQQDGWELIKVGSISPADALEQARNMCRQGVDMGALAASELADALPAAEEDVCANTIWYLPSQTGGDRKSTRLNSSHANISYAVFCLKKKTSLHTNRRRSSDHHRSLQQTS